MTSLTACRLNDKWMMIHSQPRSQLVSLTNPIPLTHVVLASDVAQDGIALGDLVLTVHEVGQLEGKGQVK